MLIYIGRATSSLQIFNDDSTSYFLCNSVFSFNLLSGWSNAYIKHIIKNVVNFW